MKKNNHFLRKMNQEKTNIYFTVKLPVKSAGLADKLNQLTKLYNIGKNLSYTYIHTPFISERSSNKKFFTRLVEKIFGISINNNRIMEFLGLDKNDLNINEVRFKNYQIVEIYLDKILTENNISQISQLKEYIENSESSSDNIIYSFVWTFDMYRFENKLRSLLADTSIEGIQSFLSKRYWQVREKWPVNLPFNENKIKIVVHIRKGDRACIKLDSKIIDPLPQTRLIQTIEEASSQQIDTYSYYAILQDIFAEFGEDKFDVFLITDGYYRAFKIIKGAIRRGNLKLSKEELKQLSEVEKNIHDIEFKDKLNYSNLSTIIGESEENTYKSIHALAIADIIITGLGGFGYAMNNNFRKQENSTLIVDVKHYDNRTIDSIAKIVKAKHNCEHPNV